MKVNKYEWLVESTSSDVGLRKLFNSLFFWVPNLKIWDSSRKIFKQLSYKLHEGVVTTKYESYSFSGSYRRLCHQLLCKDCGVSQCLKTKKYKHFHINTILKHLQLNFQCQQISPKVFGQVLPFA